MWEARASRFPEHTPNTREYYLLRSIFEEQFPSQQALATVPKVCLQIFVTCYSVKAIYTTACAACQPTLCTVVRPLTLHLRHLRLK